MVCFSIILHSEKTRNWSILSGRLTALYGIQASATGEFAGREPIKRVGGILPVTETAIAAPTDTLATALMHNIPTLTLPVSNPPLPSRQRTRSSLIPPPHSRLWISREGGFANGADNGVELLKVDPIAEGVGDEMGGTFKQHIDFH